MTVIHANPRKFYPRNSSWQAIREIFTPRKFLAIRQLQLMLLSLFVHRFPLYQSLIQGGCREQGIFSPVPRVLVPFPQRYDAIINHVIEFHDYTCQILPVIRYIAFVNLVTRQFYVLTLSLFFSFLPDPNTFPSSSTKDWRGILPPSQERGAGLRSTNPLPGEILQEPTQQYHLWNDGERRKEEASGDDKEG